MLDLHNGNGDTPGPPSAEDDTEATTLHGGRDLHQPVPTTDEREFTINITTSTLNANTNGDDATSNNTTANKPSRVNRHGRAIYRTNSAESFSSMESQSSNDGIEWDESAFFTSNNGSSSRQVIYSTSRGASDHRRPETGYRNYESEENRGHHAANGFGRDDDGTESDEDDDEDDDDEDLDLDDEYYQDDTQHLLLASSNAKKTGLGTGLRVGEIGTGTTLGLDLENRSRYREDQNSAQGGLLPMSDIPSRKHNSKKQKNRQQRASHPRVNHEQQPFRDSTSQSSSAEMNGHDRKKYNKGSRKDQRRRQEEGREEMAMGLGAIRTENERRLAKRKVQVNLAWNIFYVLAWYGCSTSLSFYNKWLFSTDHHNFRFPLFTTSLHMVAQFLLASLTMFIMPALRPKSIPSGKDFRQKIVPCAVASGLDIGLSNSSLKTITLAFYTMCKSSSLAFVLLFAFAFKLEKPTWLLVGVIGVICVGLFLMVMSEVSFVWIGFIQVMMASVLGGLRWSLTQILLEKSDAQKGSLTNPISTVFFLSPIMGICLFIVSGIVEGYGEIFSSDFFSSFGQGLGTLGLLFLGGIFAFAMVVAEFNLIARTSVVSLSILGIVKEVATIVVSSLVFHDQLTFVNILGLFVTLAGIGFYHFMKLREMKIKSRIAVQELADQNLTRQALRRERALERRKLAESLEARSNTMGAPASTDGSSGSSSLITPPLSTADPTTKTSSLLQQDPRATTPPDHRIDNSSAADDPFNP